MVLEAFDLETHLIQPGLLAPPIVCGSWARQGRPSALIKADQGIFDSAVTDMLLGEQLIVGANIAYDFGCLAARDPSLLPLIFKAYDEERVFDVLIAQTLDSIYHGYLQDGYIIDPRTQRPLQHPHSKKQVFRYSLETVVDLNLGRKDAKANDLYRTRYALLEHLPIDKWPPEARQYPIDDAENTLAVAEAQIAALRNLHDMPNQADAAFCEHLGAMWGIRTDDKTVAELGAELRARAAADLEKFKALGFYKPGKKKGEITWSKDTKFIKARVEAAYNGNPPLTETGAVQCSREVLEDSGDTALEEFAGVSKTEKLVGTYLPFVEAGVERPLNIKPNVLLNTGRSSYEGLIQLLPRKGKIRECFMARDGYHHNIEVPDDYVLQPGEEWEDE